MSGILCVFDPGGIEPDRPRYLAALRRLAHRGRDAEGSELRGEIFLGVRSRSAGRGPCARQPAVSEEGRYLVALDGRLHNREELLQVSGAGTGQPVAPDDAQALLCAFKALGEDCFARMRGPWAAVVWDAAERRLLLARDPFGIKPLYYYRSGGSLLAGSEIKAILALDTRARQVDTRRLAALVCDGRIDDWSWTCFKGIEPVPPGTVLTFQDERVAARRYWRLRPPSGPVPGPAEIRDTLVGAVARHVPADARIGLALSGGIDSATLAGILSLSRQSARPRVEAFSITPPQATDESSLIDATVRRTGLPHAYVPLDGLDYVRLLDELIDAHDEPVQYCGVFYQYVLRRRMAEAGCQVALVGYGADEIFAGYRDLGPPFLAALVAGGRLGDAVRFVRGAGAFMETSPRVLAGFAARYGLQQGRAALLGPLQGTWLQAAWRRRAEGRFAAAGDLMLASAGTGDEDGIGTDAGLEPPHGHDGRLFVRELLGCFRRNIALLVRLEDRNAEAHGLELCVPFMDEELARVVFALPFHRHMENGRNKAVLRDAAKDLLAPEVLGNMRKLPTPGNDAHVVFDILRSEFLDLMSSASFRESGLWSRRCREYYLADAATRERGGTWFRVYLAARWWERVARAGAAGCALPACDVEPPRPRTSAGIGS